VSWRGKIGRIKGTKCAFNSNLKLNLEVVLLNATVLAVILIIGGIELNPGPTIKVSYTILPYII
jgi:hypothetical protein